MKLSDIIDNKNTTKDSINESRNKWELYYITGDNKKIKIKQYPNKKSVSVDFYKYIETMPDGYMGLTMNKVGSYYKENNVNEAIEYPIHHTTFSNAAEAAKDYAMKRGYQIDEDDWQTEVAYGGKYTRSRPSVGKTHSFNVQLLRNGKLQKKALHFQVYGMKNGYELTAYIM